MCQGGDIDDKLEAALQLRKDRGEDWHGIDSRLRSTLSGQIRTRSHRSEYFVCAQ